MYCTVDDLKNERVWADGHNDRQFEQAVVDAGDAINIKLSGQYNVPFSPVPTSIRRLCIELACCFLLQNKAMVANEEELQSIKFVCDKAYKDLHNIAASHVNLGQQRKGTTNSLIYSGNQTYRYVEDE